MATGDPREIRRATAVNFYLCGVEREKISKGLFVSVAFVDKWTGRYFREGVDSLLLQYKGSEGYLTEEEHDKIITHLKRKKNISLDYVIEYVESEYGVVYKSRQSYYDLLHEARYSWKKSEKENPKRDAILVEKKHEEITKLLDKHRDEIESGELVVWIEDETHLVWGDACGYIWGKTNKKTLVKIVNERERQTFYGAFNYHTHKVVVNKYESADSVNTIKYIEHLRLLSSFKNILIIWDGASYHRFAEMPKYLSRINEGLSEDNWKVRCVLLAPHAPEENPMEDIWLKAKNWLRKNFNLNKTFNDVIECFTSYFEVNTFNFPKMSIFGIV